MSADLSKIRFQNARIIRVIEDTDQRRLTFEVTYPLKDSAVDFEAGKLTFELYSRYVIAERDMNGEPTVLRAELTEASSRSLAIRIQTDYGTREVTCYRVGDGVTFAEPGAGPNERECGQGS
jgi:hypothetical protein